MSTMEQPTETTPATSNTEPTIPQEPAAEQHSTALPSSDDAGGAPVQEEDDDFVPDSFAKEVKSYLFEDRLETASKRKVKGNKFFSQQKNSSALALYRSGLYHVEFDEMSWNFELIEQHRNDVNVVRLPLLLNAAACCLRIAEQGEVVADKLETQDNKTSKESGEETEKATGTSETVEAKIKPPTQDTTGDDTKAAKNSTVSGEQTESANKKDEKEGTASDSTEQQALTVAPSAPEEEEEAKLALCGPIKPGTNYLDLTIEYCVEALKIEPKSTKALYRKGQALLLQGKVDKALVDLKAAAKLAPSDRGIRGKLNEAVNLLKEEKMQTKAFWKETLEKEMNTPNQDTEVENFPQVLAPGQRRLAGESVCKRFFGKMTSMFS